MCSVLFFGAFAQSQKAPISFRRVLPSVRLYQRGSPGTDFREDSNFAKTVREYRTLYTKTEVLSTFYCWTTLNRYKMKLYGAVRKTEGLETLLKCATMLRYAHLAYLAVYCTVFEN